MLNNFTKLFLFFCIFLYFFVWTIHKTTQNSCFFPDKKYKKIQKNHEISNVKSIILKTELKTQRCYIGCKQILYCY